MPSWIGSARSPRRLVAVVGAIAALASGLAAIAASSSASAAGGDFKVLFIGPLSGGLGFVGKIEANGYQAAVNVVNRTGGVGPKHLKMKLEVADAGGEGAKTVAVAMEKMAQTNYGAVTCGAFADDGLPCAAAIRKKRVLQIAPIAEKQIFDRKAYPRLFSAGTLFTPGLQGLALKMKKDKIKRFAIVIGDNQTGRSGAPVLVNAAKRAGIEVTRTSYVPIGAVDATPQIQQAQASGAQAIAIVGFTPPNPAILKARTKLGWNVPVYCDWLCSSMDFGDLAKSERDGVISQVWPWMVQGSKATKTKAAKTMISEFFKVNGPDLPLAIDAVNVLWNLPLLVQAAAKKARSTNVDKMVKALENLGDSKTIPYFVGPKRLYTKNYHAFRTQPSDFIYVKAGDMKNGFIVSGS